MKKDKSLLNRNEIIRYLGYRNQEPDEIMLEEIKICEDEFYKVMDPKFHYEVFDLKREGGRLMLSDESFEFIGENIKKHLSGCEKVAFSCATLSEGVDELIDQAQKEDMLMAFIYDAIANAVVEEVRAKAEFSVANDYPDYFCNWQYGIGYGDLPLSLQPLFLNRINAKETIGLTCNDRCLLVPLKSVTGFIGLSKKEQKNNGCNQRSCLTCNNQERCIYRKNDMEY
ncbi:vitamin B12 dependent methionine synthase activation region [Lachnoclostridium phytofermentans]|uniref:Vitamin B12 dependent methionine synthase activation region n=1 Tax=Lachnoclostridium phytofermentans (strain ATCC 700394 / DSM 18823 / ISDg) TaxID=357809 RepID=A9KNT5_LACP7|nr:vitamin B12 dependent methionine synthase activation region [Lachnoclostridium phytofermentans]ABX41686.1 Vitamin B12 dependent methionine synthase activation region [Lachnoclostridium phytofermentans ISDg]